MNWQTCRNLLVSSLTVWGSPTVSAASTAAEVVLHKDHFLANGKTFRELQTLLGFLRQQGVRTVQLQPREVDNYELVGKVIYAMVQAGLKVDMPRERALN